MTICPADTHVSPTGCPVSDRAAAFNPFEGAYQIDPAEALRWAREDEPVFYSPELGYWVVARYEDVKSVFRDPILFSPAIALEKITPAPPEAMEILKKHGFAMERTMVNEDEPQHMERRRLLLNAFLPEALAQHEDAIRRLTRQYMDRFIDRGQADLVADIFREIPMAVALHFLGVRNDEAEELKAFSVAHTLNTWGRPTPAEQLEISENVGRFWAASSAIVDRMMADPSGDGWMVETVRMHRKHPDIVPESYIRSMMMAILVAAHETTANATANMFWTLLSDRPAWDEICANPHLIPSAVEECLRVAGSIVAWRRIATDDARVGGVAIPKGGKLLIVMASANRDPRHWENADTVDIYRDNAAEHLTFGYGAHQCMGKNIARMEMRIFLEEFTRRLPHLRMVPGQRFESLPNTSFRGPKRLLVDWDPGQNPERGDATLLDAPQHFPIGAPERDDILRRVTVLSKETAADGITQFTLGAPNGRPLPAWSPGAHVDLVAGDFRRKYSLCGRPGDATYTIAILRDDQGTGGSRHFCETLAPGDMVQIAGPKNHFRLDETTDDYLLIAGGIGITPILAMADRLKALGKRYRLLYCGATRARMALLDRVAAHPVALHVTDESTRLDLATLTAKGPVYACGPDRLLDALSTLDWDEGQLRVEYFTSGATGYDPERDHGFTVELADSELTLQVAPEQTLYDALRAAGIDVGKDCGEGLCGSCEVPVIDGEIDHRDWVLSAAERAEGRRMMSCCSRAAKGWITLGL